MKFEYFVFLVTLFMSLSAHAMPDVCTLSNTEVPASVRVDASEISAYKAKLLAECAMSEKYQQMQMKARKLEVSLEQISEYQAIRYVRRYDYERAKGKNTPVPKIYQIMDKDYTKDLSEQSSIIWDNYMAGIRQLGTERARVSAGGSFTINDLKRIQAGFYTLSDECEHGVETSKLEEVKCGDSAHFPHPGEIRPPSPNDGHWWILKPEEVSKITSIVADKNETYASYGFVQNALNGLSGDTFATQIISVREITTGKFAGQIGIFEGDSRVNVDHLNAVLDFMNKNLAQARSGQHMVYKNHIYSPMQVALIAQQALVDIHPFFEGNGRTSRFLQELVLTLFALPHGASGDLMSDDVLTRQGEYYQQAMSTTTALLTKVDSCFEVTYQQEAKASGGKSDRTSKGSPSTQVSTPVNVSILNPMNLDYSCQVIR